MFRQVKTLKLKLDGKLPLYWIGQISAFVDLQQVSRIVIEQLYSYDASLINLDDVRLLLSLTPKLRHLRIFSARQRSGSNLRVSDPRSLIPPHVKHLKIPVAKVTDAIGILQQCDRLISLELCLGELAMAKDVEELENWLDENRCGSDHLVQRRRAYIWLGEDVPQPPKKRLKSSHSEELH